ncbi:MAG: immunoglobulin domain-containing protein, partial [Verrucomicrobia bacterium]|nr:immunoglobulin domain-containing protein [Verrucomicrobiota bacterium]
SASVVYVGTQTSDDMRKQNREPVSPVVSGPSLQSNSLFNMNSIISKRFSGSCRLAGLAVMLCMFLCAQVTWGDVLVLYSFPGTSNATSVAANMTASACTNRSLFVWAQDSPTPAYASAPVLRVAPQNSTTTEVLAVANSCYFFFTLTASTNYTINATNLTFNAARGGGGTPRGYGVRSSVDNFATDLATADLATQRNTWTPVSVTLGSAFTNLATVTFRIYVYSTGNGATVEFDDVKVNGTINGQTGPPPVQPVTLALYNFGTNTAGTSNAALVAANMNASACTNNGLPTWELGTMTYGYPTQPPLRVTPAANAISEATAVANNSYYFFTLTASNGFWINGSTLTFDVARGGAGTPRGYGVRSSVDNFATDLYTADAATVRPTWENIVVNLGSAFQNLSTVTFRIYVYAPAGSSIEFDDLTVNGNVLAQTVPPIITAQPTNNIIVVGGSSTFTVAANSITNIFYQWYTNGVTTNLVADTSSAGTNASYTYANASLADNGRTFRVVLTNVFGASTSSVAVLTVLTPDVHILASPVSQTNAEWATVTFTVGALGAAPLYYQWCTNGVPVDGATNSAFTTPPLHPFPWNGLPITVVVSNALSVATSAPPAYVTVIPETVPPHFTAAIARGAPASAITVWFDEAVFPNPANYTIPGVTVLGAVRGENSNSVNLITTPLTPGNTYYLTVNGTLDQDAQTPNPSASVNVCQYWRKHGHCRPDQQRQLLALHFQHGHLSPLRLFHHCCRRLRGARELWRQGVRFLHRPGLGGLWVLPDPR